MCKHGDDGVSTWAKFDDHIYPFITYYCLHVKYIVYKHFDRSLHVGLSEPTCVQNLRSVLLTVFEILGFKQDEEYIGEMDLLSPMLENC